MLDRHGEGGVDGNPRFVGRTLGPARGHHDDDPMGPPLSVEWQPKGRADVAGVLLLPAQVLVPGGKGGNVRLKGGIEVAIGAQLVTGRKGDGMRAQLRDIAGSDEDIPVHLASLAGRYRVVSGGPAPTEIVAEREVVR